MKKQWQASKGTLGAQLLENVKINFSMIFVGFCPIIKLFFKQNQVDSKHHGQVLFDACMLWWDLILLVFVLCLIHVYVVVRSNCVCVSILFE